VKVLLKIAGSPARIGWFIVKLAGYLLLVLVFAGSLYVLVQAHELNLLAQFQALQRVDPIPKARQLANAGEYCEALEHLDYFRQYDYVRENREVSKLYAEIKAKREAYLFVLSDVWSGIWKGKGACMESLVSATVTDFLVVGDVRDLVWGAVNKYYGRESDNFTMALAGIGVLLTGVTVVATPTTGGTAAPAGISAKVSVSLLKLAKRMGKLPRSLQKSLLALFRQCKRIGSLRPLAPVSRSIYKISRVKGLKIRDFLTIMSRSRNIKDIKFMERVARAYGKQTGKFLKLGGQAPIKVLHKFGKSKGITKAVDVALEYGPRGTRLLEKTGPSKFLKYVKIAKYSTRATRSIWKHRLPALLAEFMKLLPQWITYLVGIVSGFLALAVPGVYARRAVRRVRSNA